MSNKKPVLGITMGDFNGIGPEVAFKAALSPRVRKICHPVLIGSTDVFAKYATMLRFNINLREILKAGVMPAGKTIEVINPFPFHAPKIRTGTLTKEAGLFAGKSIQSAVRLCLDHQIDAMVTAPVSKETMQLAGFNYPGQTEMLAHLSSSKTYMMVLAAGAFRVGLATIHVPLKDVATSLSMQILMERINSIHSSLKKDFGIASPRIAVLGLNPHAGENGTIGKEEQEMIKPAMMKAKKKLKHLDGPFPADGFFGKHLHKKYDAILAMYHDQGLIPLKMSGFDIGVNFTAGLAIVRTSPDHGTAFDIAGKGIANPLSTIEACLLAVHIVQNRKKA